ncbi:hypothetical protein MACK_000324 [Theileria orientalis]|uniref:Uncharacterized protein n=1 Tax=Theileria orientalis TaxID=68886 RepID=A0A976M9G1_THEOR|nr:hypothetical protein MACK_000324 [Theileria orientalis]
MKSRHRSIATSENRDILNDSASSSESSRTDVSNSCEDGICESDSSSSLRDYPLYAPRISGGCIISERPIFLRNSVLCLINNRKCTLYSSQDARRLCDTLMSPEMIVGSRSFIYENEYEILLCASSNGSVLVYNVPNYAYKLNFHEEEPERRELDLILELKIECKNLLAIEVNKESGEMICVIITHQLKTEVIKLDLNYEKILFTDGYEKEDGIEDDIIYIKTLDAKDSESMYSNVSTVNDSNDNAIKVNKGSKRKEKYRKNDLNKREDNETDANRNNNELIKAYKRIVSLESNLEVFEVDRSLSRVALGVNKSCLVIDLKTEQSYYFENDSVITCIGFDNRGSMALGDGSGQIIIISVLDKTCFGNTNYISTVTCAVLGCKMSSNTSILSLSSHFNTIKKNIKANREGNRGVDHGEYVLGKVETKRLHWHSHGVNCITYNEKNVNMLLSGGEEGVVVVWDLVNHSKKFVTRLGAPIFHIAMSEDQTIMASLQNNAIILIDATSLSIRAKVSSLIVDMPLCDRCDQERRVIEYYPSSWMKEVVERKAIGSVDESRMGIKYTGRNSIVIANTNKLQVYDYVRDCETKLIDITNVNYVSRQDEETGQHYHITNSEEYTLQTNINNPHSKRVTSLKQLYHKNKFLSTSLDGKVNVYSLVQISDSKAVSVVDGKTGGLPMRIQSREMWIIEHVVDYKELPIHSMSINENNMILLRHDCVLSLWKYFESYENGLMNMKAMALNMAQDVFYVEFVNDESILLCTRKRIEIYNLKNNAKSSLLETGDDEEVNSVLVKFSLIIVNIRRRIQNVNCMDYMEIYDVNKKVKVYSKVIKGLNSRFDIKLLPYPLQTMKTRTVKVDKESMSKPLFKSNQVYYHLLIINGHTHDIEVIPIIKEKGNYIIEDNYYDEEENVEEKRGVRTRCKRIRREESHVNQLGKLIQNMLTRCKESGSKNIKGKYNLCNKYYRLNSYKCKRIDVEKISELYNNAEALPRPNVLLDHIINNLL